MKPNLVFFIIFFIRFSAAAFSSYTYTLQCIFYMLLQYVKTWHIQLCLQRLHHRVSACREQCNGASDRWLMGFFNIHAAFRCQRSIFTSPLVGMYLFMRRAARDKAFRTSHQIMPSSHRYKNETTSNGCLVDAWSLACFILGYYILGVVVICLKCRPRSGTLNYYPLRWNRLSAVAVTILQCHLAMEELQTHSGKLLSSPHRLLTDSHVAPTAFGFSKDNGKRWKMKFAVQSQSHASICNTVMLMPQCIYSAN